MNCGDVFRSILRVTSSPLCVGNTVWTLGENYKKTIYPSRWLRSVSVYMCYARVKVSSVFKQCSKLEISNLFSTKSERGNEIFVEIFNFIEYASNTACYITLHNDF